MMVVLEAGGQRDEAARWNETWMQLGQGCEGRGLAGQGECGLGWHGFVGGWGQTKERVARQRRGQGEGRKEKKKEEVTGSTS